MSRGRSQTSKRSRKHKKQAIFAGLYANTGHPSHISARLLRIRKLTKRRIESDHFDELQEVKIDE